VLELLVVGVAGKPSTVVVLCFKIAFARTVRQKLPARAGRALRISVSNILLIDCFVIIRSSNNNYDD
jgi:hypothetical protein